MILNDQGGDQALLNYYDQYKEIIEVKRLVISKPSIVTANEFLSGVTSKRQHDHYSQS